MTSEHLKFRLLLPDSSVLRKKLEMPLFREARLMLLDSYDDGLIDEEELVMLYDLNTSKNPVFPYKNYERFELNNMDEAECKAKFRFEKSDLPQLAEALRMCKCLNINRQVFVMGWRVCACF